MCGGVAALFGPYYNLDSLDRGELPEKVPQKGVPPILGTLWRFRGFPSQNGVPDRHPRECKPAEKTVHHSSGVISEVLPTVNLGLGHAGSAKLTLGRTSEMTPEGWCTVFSAGLHSLGGGAVWHTVLTGKSPISPKSAQNRGYPLFGHFFRKFPPFQGV